jgi:hypothetical protein
MVEVKIIVSELPSDLNKQFLNHILENLLAYVKAGLVLEIEIALKKNKSQYDKKEIKLFPHMIHPQKTIPGNSDKIIEFLEGIKQNKAPPKKVKGGKSVLNEYWTSLLAESDSDSDDNGDTDRQQRMQTEVQRRQGQNENFSTGSKSKRKNKQRNKPISNANIQPRSNMQTRSNNVKDMSASTAIDNLSKSGQGTVDDNLMKNFFENQEATPI